MIGLPLKVRELLDEIARGKVLLPEIQRAYVWKGPQVAKLLDSLYKEYPAGQILLWDTAQLPITKPLEGVDAPPLPAAGQPTVVLDGQQRLTSLHKALNKTEDGIEVYFNLDSQQFQLYHRRLKADPLWISVRAVLNNVRADLRILQDIEAAGGPSLSDPRTQVYLDRLQRLKRVGEYKFPIEIFRSDDYEVVAELFVRINSAGTHLRAAELVLAQLALRLPGTVVDRFEEALDDYEEMGFSLDTRFLMRAFIALGTGQSRFRFLAEFWRKSQGELEGIWQRTRKAVDSAVNFVRQNARFESSDWLPSLNAMVPLAVYFDKHLKIVKDVEVGLLRWFYLASLRGRYSASVETNLDEDLKAVASADPVVELVKHLGPTQVFEVGPEEFDDAGWRNPLFPMTYAIARKRGAKDWFRGIALGTDVVGEEHQIHVHHVFPKALLNKMRVQRKDRDEIANLAFLAARADRQISMTPPEKYLPEIADKHPDRLEAQSIPMDRSLWKLERFQDFLVVRRQLLAGAINELIKNPS